MTSEETQKFKDLCAQIISEKNEARYLELVQQLDDRSGTEESMRFAY